MPRLPVCGFHFWPYLHALELALSRVAKKDLRLTACFEYFCGEVLAAQNGTLGQVRFLVVKTQLYNRLND
jgi:hypothetical protein